MIAARDVTLGVLAGGRGSRLGGCDKAWIERDGVPQIVRIARRFANETHAVLVSANRDAAKFEALGFRVVADRLADLGPIGGLDALASACTTPWLLTIPVDLVAVNDCLLPTLASAGGAGASIEDDDGVQPLVALWDVESLRACLSSPRRRGSSDVRGDPLDSRLRGNDGFGLSVQSLQSDLAMPRIRLAGVRFGNLNTFDDLAAAGARVP